MDKQLARTNLLNAVRLVVAGLEDIGIPALKGRDHREPGWREKEAYENKLRFQIVKHFGKQRRNIREKLTSSRKKLDYDDDFFTDEELEEALIRILKDAAKDGVLLFGKKGLPQINYDLVNEEAAEWADNYVFDLIKDINKVSAEQLDNMQDIFNEFVETPGTTIGDVMDQLTMFSEDRAQRIAVTEITRTYAKAHQIAGDEMKKEFPDVKVIKIWYTNNDDLVCEFCGPLNGTEVEVNENFYDIEDAYQDGNPPQHVNCRCWMETTTDILAGEEEENSELINFEETIRNNHTESGGAG